MIIIIGMVLVLRFAFIKAPQVRLIINVIKVVRCLVRILESESCSNLFLIERENLF